MTPVDGDGLPPEAMVELNRTLERRLWEEAEKNREKDRLIIVQSRLATMGQMVGSLAHQWRQPLNFIGLILQDIKSAHEHGSLTPEYLDDGVREGMDIVNSLSRTIGDFRDFFEPDREQQSFSVNAMVGSAASLVAASFANHAIGLKLSAEGEVVAEGYAHEYSRVVLILLNNAKEALVGRATREPSVCVHIGAAGPRSLVTVTDNAGGISEAEAARIFDPFSSPREMGQGGGVGLFIAKTLIEKQMSGRLTARDVDGRTEFSIIL